MSKSVIECDLPMADARRRTLSLFIMLQAKSTKVSLSDHAINDAMPLIARGGKLHARSLNEFI